MAEIREKIITEKKIIKLKFSAVGDVMLHSPQLSSAYNSSCKCWDFNPVFERVKPFLVEPDILLGNLETTLPGNPSLFSAYPLFGSPDEIVTALKSSGFDIITTSNNHSLDKGKAGLRRTLDILDQNQIPHTGTFRTPEEYEGNKYLLINKNDWKIAIIAYTYGTNGIAIPKDVKVNIIDNDQISKDIEAARLEKPDLIIVSYHFGPEYARLPDKFQKEVVAHTFREGADIIIGSHPHVVQPYELGLVADKFGKVKKRLVAYSLGNFISSQYWRYSNGGIIFNFEVEKTKDGIDIKNISFVPVFVYPYYDKGLKYTLLPAKDFLENDNSFKLTVTANKLIKEFYTDTIAHLEKK